MPAADCRFFATLRRSRRHLERRHHRVRAGAGSVLLSVAASGGEPRRSPRLPRKSESSLAGVLTRWAAFLVRGPAETTIYVGSLDSAERTRVLAADLKALYAPSGHLLCAVEHAVRSAVRCSAPGVDRRRHPVTDQGRVSAANNIGGAAFSVSTKGELVCPARSRQHQQAAHLVRSGPARIGVVGSPADYRGVELSPDGHRIAEHPHDLKIGGDTWLFDLVRGTSSRFTFGGHSSAAIWSPDGSRIVFASNQSTPGVPPLADPIYGGTFNLYEKRADNSGEPRLVLDAVAAKQSLTWKQPTSWAPDGQLILYEAFDPKTTWDIWGLPMSGDRRPRPLAHSEFEGRGQSPCGRWLVHPTSQAWRSRPLSKRQASLRRKVCAMARRRKGALLPSADRKVMAADGAEWSAFRVGFRRPVRCPNLGTFFQANPIPPRRKRCPRIRRPRWPVVLIITASSNNPKPRSPPS